MNRVGSAELEHLFARAEISVGDPRFGRSLSFRPPSPRGIVVHMGRDQSEDLTLEIVLKVLELAPNWLLVPRVGTASELELLSGHDDAAAILFESNEIRALATYLCTRIMNPTEFSTDLYILSADGDRLITCDHDTDLDGLDVELQKIADASRLLVSLNELGARIRGVYATDREEWLRLVAPLGGLDRDLTDFAKAYGMELYHWTCDTGDLRGRSLFWGRGIQRMITISLADRQAPTYDISVGVREPSPPPLWPTNETIRRGLPLSAIREGLRELLEVSRERAEALAKSDRSKTVQ